MLTTKDKSRPTVEVPDDDVDSETLLAWTPDRRWRTWTCPGCGGTSAGYHQRTDLALCGLCTSRLAQGRPLLDGKSLWEEVMAELEVKAAGARITRGELAEAAEARRSPEGVYADALDAELLHTADPDGTIREARCARCRGPVRASDGRRFGTNLHYCSGCDWRRTA